MNLFLRPFIITTVILFFGVMTGCAQEPSNTQEQTEPNADQNEEAVELPDTWYGLEEAQALASEDGKKVLVYAEAVWCPYCVQMNKEVFPLDEVQQVTEEYFYPVRVDIESQDSLTFRGQQMTEAQFSQVMQVSGTPTFIFFDSDGEIIAVQPGFIPAEMYTQILEYVGTDAYQEQSFDEFAEVDTTAN